MTVFQRDLEATLTVFNWPFIEVHERPYMDPSSFASTPFFGGEVRLLTYIRPLTAASI
jgi:hypothetical protein